MNPYRSPSPPPVRADARWRHPLILLMAGFALRELCSACAMVPAIAMLARFGDSAIYPAMTAIVAAFLLCAAVYQVSSHPARGAALFTAAACMYVIALVWLSSRDAGFSRSVAAALIPDAVAGIGGSVLGLGLALRMRRDSRIA